MGLERFGEMLKSELASKFPKFEVLVHGDPAGMREMRSMRLQLLII